MIKNIASVGAPKIKKSKWSDHPWDRAATLELVRKNPSFGSGEVIDSGANFFVLVLEALGAKTKFCCEGHPSGFYVAFDADYGLALRIQSAGFFTVEIEGQGYWSIRKTRSETMASKPYTEAEKNRTLRWAAESWMGAFGPEIAASEALSSVIRSVEENDH